MTRDQRISVGIVFTAGVLAALAVMGVAFGASSCASTPAPAQAVATTCEQEWTPYMPDECSACLCNRDDMCLCRTLDRCAAGGTDL